MARNKDSRRPRRPQGAQDRIRTHLEALYGRDQAPALVARLQVLLEASAARIRRPQTLPRDDSGGLPLGEGDAILITYGDQFRRPGEPPLVTLRAFLEEYLGGVVSGVHVLPFFPYSSDDGFSVIDFRAVNPEWGGWDDAEAIAGGFRLMVDLVLNHVSAGSAWFQAFLRDREPFTDYFIVVPPGTDVSQVVRPRALPLLTPVQTESGEKLVWTTFSADQIDLNYRNPDVLLEMIRTLLLYVEKGVQVVRLDAIAYLWKEIGTSCIHLPETHRVVQLFRAVLDAVAPWVLILTETNVPHRDNVSYFGNGANEAQLVYQFSLPPLVLDAFRRADAGHLRRWASDLGAPAGNVTFFNFLASHDGVGLNPVRGILGDSEIQDLARMVESRGGTVSYRSGPSGDRPYELNISYFDAIAGAEAEAGKPVELPVRKFLCSQAVMLAFRGVPGIYIHSMLGTRNYLEGVEATGMNRTINRRKFTLEEIRGLLDDPGSIQAQVFRGYTELLHARRSASAFHPLAAQRVLDAPRPVFALLRESRDGAERILCAFNTSEDEVRLRVAARELGIPAGLPARELAGGGALGDGSGSRWDGAQLELTLNPYGFRWLAW